MSDNPTFYDDECPECEESFDFEEGFCLECELCTNCCLGHEDKDDEDHDDYLPPEILRNVDEDDIDADS